ncbi:MAG: hypothetical protein OEL89_00050 [Candidatus Peregrinibacteria bacterium]|nr:hypothetical protein [Candidatus Peregrinibacteria bacterium]
MKIEEYKEIERELIARSFEITRHEFDHDQDLENDQDVLKALNLYKNVYYMNRSNELIAIEIFYKHGLWKDGKTTLIEHDRQELQKKIEQTIRYKEIRENKIKRLKELKDAIDVSLKKIEEEPKLMRKRLENKRQELRNQAHDELKNVALSHENKMQDLIKTLSIQYQDEIKRITEKLRLNIEVLKKDEKNEINKIIEEYAELSKLRSQYDELEGEYETEKGRFEDVMEKTDASLFNLTVKELKELADNKGIEYPVKIIKKDLVQLIEKSEEID